MSADAGAPRPGVTTPGGAGPKRREGGALRLGSILGFEISLDFSWFVIFFLLLWSLSAGVFPAELPDRSTTAYLVMGTIGTLLFFASLVAHELSHSLVARTRGIPVEGITLFIFGGMAKTRLEAENPGDEFVIAVVGPVASLVIAALFGLLAWIGGPLGWSPEVTIVARYLAFVNVLLAGFNLMPGFPLDGGRVFRALVWRTTGDVKKATRWATAGGKWFGYLLMAFGALQLFAGGTVGGLWLVFIGWFLRNAAVMGYRQHVVRRWLADVPAEHLMTADPDVVGPDLTLDAAVEEHFLRRRHGAFPVVEDGRPIGLVSLGAVKRVARDAWATTRVRDIMTDVSEIAVDPRASAVQVLELLQDADSRRALVVRDGLLVGIISASDVTAWIQREEELENLGGGR